MAQFSHAGPVHGASITGSFPFVSIGVFVFIYYLNDLVERKKTGGQGHPFLSLQHTQYTLIFWKSQVPLETFPLTHIDKYEKSGVFQRSSSYTV